MSENAPSLETPPTLESVKAAYEAKREEYDKRMEKLTDNVGLHSAIWQVVGETRGEREKRERAQARDQQEGWPVGELERGRNDSDKSVERALGAQMDLFNRKRADLVTAADKAGGEMGEQKALYIKMGGDPRNLTPSRFDIA